MAQFDIYRRPGEGIEYLLELQDNLLDRLSTRVVAPLARADLAGPGMKTLNPRISISGEDYLLLTHLLAAIPATMLGEPVASARGQRDTIVAALDLLFTGI